jgi:hypothetical protein
MYSLSFPTISEGLYVVLIAESKTGIVLKLDLTRYLSDVPNTSVYAVLPDLDSCYSFINEKKLQRDFLEFIIYNDKQEVIKFINF